jgi:hypothetical protein
VDFTEFRELIAQTYPRCTQKLVREVLNKIRLLTDHTGEVCTRVIHACATLDTLFSSLCPRALTCAQLDQHNFRDSMMVLTEFMAYKLSACHLPCAHSPTTREATQPH